jgi:hypothetical protein
MNASVGFTVTGDIIVLSSTINLSFLLIRLFAFMSAALVGRISVTFKIRNLYENLSSKVRIWVKSDTLREGLSFIVAGEAASQ